MKALKQDIKKWEEITNDDLAGGGKRVEGCSEKRD